MTGFSNPRYGTGMEMYREDRVRGLKGWPFVEGGGRCTCSST